ncbi:hypothetical protein RRG08_063462 [Elysia crispata]|uniref:Uncharacterized protein n=1 Tax=Elysia crispata TaxID=231223 RepID=A0AAE1AAP3_9GAST|nr:hypothetical protein RRG08_063462 [Elysia crispata]
MCVHLAALDLQTIPVAPIRANICCPERGGSFRHGSFSSGAGAARGARLDGGRVGWDLEARGRGRASSNLVM